jgi:hypothetical protein
MQSEMPFAKPAKKGDGIVETCDLAIRSRLVMKSARNGSRVDFESTG